jgi:hypothetical protein
LLLDLGKTKAGFLFDGRRLALEEDVLRPGVPLSAAIPDPS